MGPCKAMRTGASKSLRANSTSSARGSLCHTIGPCEHSTRQQSRWLHNIWAHARAPAAACCGLDGPMLANRQNAMVHATGPREAMRTVASESMRANSTSSARGSSFTPLAHASILPGSSPVSFATFGPTRQYRQQTAAGLMGQCLPIVKMLWCMQRAHARPCAQGLPSLCGPTPLPRQGAARVTPLAHASIPLGSSLVGFAIFGPTREHRQQPAAGLMGQCLPIVKMLWRMQRAHARPCAQGLPSLCGPTPLPRQGAAHLHRWPMRAFRSATVPLASQYLGPRESIGSSLLRA